MIASTPAEMDATAPTAPAIKAIVKRRVFSYWAVAVSLVVGYMLMRGSGWQGSGQLHTLMEGVATLLALLVGAMALVRFYSQKDNTFLFIGAASSAPPCSTATTPWSPPPSSRPTCRPSCPR